MFKNIIFDVGEVLVHFRWKEYMEEDLGFPSETVKVLGDTIVMSDKWGKLDDGSMDEDEAPSYFKKLLPEYGQEIDRFFDGIVSIVNEYPYARDMILGLKKKGYNVYLLSNYPPKLAKKQWPGFSFFQDVDGYVISGLEKVTKPDAKIYQILLERYQLKAEECLFFDDRPVNIEGAERVGIAGKVFHGPEDVEGC